MKHLITFLFIISIFTFMSCGTPIGGNTANSDSDSVATEVQVDTVSAIDTVAVIDSTK